MNRSLKLRRLACRTARRGMLIAPVAFTDPDRGVVQCPAAPLLAASADAAANGGPPVRLGGPAVTGDGPVASGEGPGLTGDSRPAGVMVTMSYLDRDGQAAGLALIAHRDDDIDTASRLVQQWLPVFRSRRLLVTDLAPLCGGAADALALIEGAAATSDDPVYVVGRPVAPPGALDRPGLVLVDDLDRVPAGGTVVFPAHGASLRVRAEAAARGLTVLDGTCPLVAAVQQDALAYASRGDTVIIVGDAEHVVVPPLADYAGKAAVISQGRPPAGVPADDVSFVVDPAMAVDDVMPAVRDLKQRFPGLRGHHFDVLCYAATDRAQSIAAVAAASDLMLISTAAADDPIALDAVGRAARSGTPARLIRGLADLDRSELADAVTIGVTAALSAPAGSVSRLLSVLSGLGPASVVKRSVRSSREGGDPGEQWPDRRGRAERAQPGPQHAHRGRGPL